MISLNELLNFIKNTDKDNITEAKYSGKTVPLNKIMRGDVKKFKVYVNSGRKDKDGNVIAKKVNFGHGGSSAKARGEKTMQIQRDNPKRRKSFRKRHRCNRFTGSKNDKLKPQYWSCRTWSNKKVSDIV